MPKTLSAEQVQNGIDSEGFDYYMDHYAKSDLEGSPVWPLVQEYLNSKSKLVDALRAAGVDLES
jgi:hypothetical protein